MKRISRSVADLGSHYEAIVIGSGYGGGVAASRLARMGLGVALLERGKERLPGEFPDSPGKAIADSQVQSGQRRIGDPEALFDLRIGEDLNVFLGCGLGGTSLINANVSLEADSRVFDDPVWPAGIVDADLDEGYRRARAMLRPSSYPAASDRWPALNKLKAMEKAAERLDRPLVTPPLNVNFEPGFSPGGVWQPACNVCGDCCSGCNTGAKNTTQMNYLPDAAAQKAEIFCQVRVRSISKREGGGWNVHYVPVGVGRETFDAEELIVSAPLIVLAAGSLGSTEILLRSQQRGLPLSRSLGSRFTGNGDVLAFGYNNDEPIDGIGFGRDAKTYDWKVDRRRPVGPTIAGLIDLRGTVDLEDGMVIEEGAIPGGIADLLPTIMAAAAAALGDDTDSGDFFREKARELESLVRGAYHGAVNHTQTFLVMSHDGAEGELRMAGDQVEVHWPGAGGRESFKRVAARLREAVAATGGTYVPNPIWTELLGHDLVTVHPLGGCPMGEDSERGVVDSDCRVFAGEAGSAVHDGLYVCDGAVMPRSLGVNPLLTITAVAERAMIRFARARGLTIGGEPAPPQTDTVPHQRKAGIRFTEKMGGKIMPAGGGMPSDCHFVVTVIAEDAEAFLTDPEHDADLVGTLYLPAVSAEPLTIEGGRFNLFTLAPGLERTKQMEYRMPLAAADGSRWHFFGRKLIHDDPGFDLWADTTTLFVEIREGADATGPAAYKGTLDIAPADFVRQLTTMEVTDAPNLLARLGMLRRFGMFFAGQLFDTYAGLSHRPEPPAAR